MVTTRVIFLGTPRFALPTLQAILNSSTIDLVGVVTQPDRPAGRGRQLSAPPVKKIARQQGVPVIQPARVAESTPLAAFLGETRPDVGIVVAFGQILPASVFDFPRAGMLNLHASLLPAYRGAAPVAHALLNGEIETGVSIMRITRGLDSGPVLAQQKVQVDPEATAGEVEDQLSVVGAALMMDVLEPYLEGKIQPWPQDDGRASLAPSLRKADARIDWDEPAVRIHNQVRAFNPRPGAHTTFRGQSLKIWRVSMLAVDGVESKKKGASGTLFGVGKKRLAVWCGDACALELLEVQPANRQRMAAAAFANGIHLRDGEILE